MNNQTAIFVVRVTLGFCFLMYGLQKLLPHDWLGGMSHSSYAAFLRRGDVPWHAFAAHVIPWAEVVAGVALLVGFAHKFASSLVIALMIGAIIFFHRSGYFLKAGGMEYQVALIAMALLVFVAGPGAFAFEVDIRQNSPRRT